MSIPDRFMKGDMMFDRRLKGCYKERIVRRGDSINLRYTPVDC